jgi:hypothetical protein
MKQGIHNNSKWIVAATAVVALVAGGLALGSNMGFKFNAQIFGPGVPATAKGDSWLTLPDNSPYNKANILCTQLGLISTGAPAGRGIVARLIASTGGSVIYTCGQNTALAFNIVQGEGIRLRNPVLINGIIVGSDNPNNTTPIFGPGVPATAKGDNWVSVPYHTTAIKANDLCADMGLTTTGAPAGRGLVARLIASTGGSVIYTCGQNTALAFNLVTGEAVRVRNPSSKSWLPSHF